MHISYDATYSTGARARMTSPDIETSDFTQVDFIFPAVVLADGDFFQVGYFTDEFSNAYCNGDLGYFLYAEYANGNTAIAQSPRCNISHGTHTFTMSLASDNADHTFTWKAYLDNAVIANSSFNTASHDTGGNVPYLQDEIPINTAPNVDMPRVWANPALQYHFETTWFTPPHATVWRPADSPCQTPYYYATVRIATNSVWLGHSQGGLNCTYDGQSLW